MLVLLVESDFSSAVAAAGYLRRPQARWLWKVLCSTSLLELGPAHGSGLTVGLESIPWLGAASGDTPAARADAFQSEIRAASQKLRQFPNFQIVLSSEFWFLCLFRHLLCPLTLTLVPSHAGFLLVSVPLSKA